MSVQVDQRFLANLRRLGFAEGISTLVLLGIAMPLKYVANVPKAVSIVGSLHGFLFIGLCLMLMLAVRRIGISMIAAGLGMLAAVIPFGPFLYDSWLMKQIGDDSRAK